MECGDWKPDQLGFNIQRRAESLHCCIFKINSASLYVVAQSIRKFGCIDHGYTGYGCPNILTTCKNEEDSLSPKLIYENARFMETFQDFQGKT